MWSASDVLTFLLAVFVSLLLLSDVRDEMLRRLKPIIIRALENAGVLTREEYLRRSGLNQQQLLAIKHASVASQAVSAFSKSIVASQQQNGGSSSNGLTHISTNGLTNGVSVDPSPTGSSSKRRGNAAATGAAVTNSSIHGTSARQAEIHPSQEAVVAADLAVGSKPPKEVDYDAAAVEAAEANADAAAEKAAELSRPPSRSRSRKQKSDSKEPRDAAPATTPSVSSAPAPTPAPAATAPAVITPMTSPQNATPSLPTVVSPVSINVPATPNELHPSKVISPAAASLPPVPDMTSSVVDDHDLNVSGSVAPMPVPIIAGYPLTMLTVRRSLDGDLAVEEYYTSQGEKVAWRRGNIWDSDFIYTFTQGLEFMKYGSWGSPHVRKLKFVLDDVSKQLRLDWGTGSILLDDVTAIKAGKQTPVFKRYASDPQAPDHACFSVITQKRTLDLSILVSKTQRIQEKRDLLVFGLGEVTGTRTSKSAPPAATGGESTNRGDLDMRTVPIPHQKVVEAILSNERMRGIPTNGTLPNGNSMILGSANYRDEYSLSTRAGSRQSGFPVTPSTSGYYASQQNSPAGYARGNHFLPPPAARGSILHAPYAAPANLHHSQQAMQQRHLMQYSSAPAPQNGIVDQQTLPPPRFAQQPNGYAPTQQQQQPQQLAANRGSDYGGYENYDELMLRNSMLIGAATAQPQPTKQ